MSLTFESVASGVLRHRHYIEDPVSGEFERTILLEGQRTNLILRSNEFDHSYWTKDSCTATSVSDPVLGTVYRIDVTGAGPTLRRAATVISGQNVARCQGWLLKAGDIQTVVFSFRSIDTSAAGNQVTFNMVTGAFSSVGSNVNFRHATDLGDGWWLVMVGSDDTTGISSSQSMQLRGFGAGTTFYVAHAQLAEGPPFGSSRITTSSATATRSADVLALTRPLPTPQTLTAYLDTFNLGAYLGSGLTRTLLRTGVAADSFEDDQLRIVAGGVASRGQAQVSGGPTIVYSSTLDRWVRVISGGAEYSDDGGRSWAAATGADTAATYRSVCWDSVTERFVAVAGSGTNRAMWSADGKTWTQVLVTANSWRSVCAAAGSINLIVAVAANGTNRTMYSGDGGETWTDVASADETAEWFCVAYSSDLDRIVAVANTGTTRTMYTDAPGGGWTGVAAAEALGWTAVVWAGGTIQKWVAVGSGGTNRTMHSTDGTAWTSGTIAARSWAGLAYSPTLDLVVAVFATGSTITSSSANGTSFTESATSTTQARGDVAWGGGSFLALEASTGFSGITRPLITRSTTGSAFARVGDLYAQMRVGGEVFFSSIPVATTAAWTYGDRIRIGVQIREDGNGQYEIVIGYKVNGGSWAEMTASDPFDLPTAWTDDTIHIGSNGDGSAAAFIALRRLHIAAGEVDFADLEELVG